MSISGISSGSAADALALLLQRRRQTVAETPDTTATTSAASSRETFKSDFTSIVKAIQSGDIGAAQTALAKFNKDRGASAASYSPASGTQSSPVQTDLQSLVQTVQSGDLSGAQKALTTLQSDVQTARQADVTLVGGSADQVARPHHHHRHHEQAAAPTSTVASGTATDVNTATVEPASTLSAG